MKNYKNQNLTLKHFTFLMMCFLMLCFGFVLFDIIEYNNKWENFAKFDFEIVEQVQEDGSVKKIKLIETPEQLMGAFQTSALADDHTNYFTEDNEYKLSKNIDLSGKEWTPQKSEIILDGDYHTIFGLTINGNEYRVGFLETNNTTGVIKNLFFDDFTISNSYTGYGNVYTACVAAYNWGQIINCNIVNGSVSGPSTTATRHTGGITGYNTSSALVENCTSHASVDVGNYIGGIVGGNASSAQVLHCFNYGKVSGNNKKTSYPYVGGIVGYIQKGTIECCINLGEITATVTNGCYVGGIAGRAQNGTIKKSSNFGTITAGNEEATNAYAGGVLGYSTYSSTIVQDCFNVGSVTANAQESKSTTAITITPKNKRSLITLAIDQGLGMAGVAYWNFTKGEYHSLTKKAYSAGICPSKITSSDCYNIGTIKGGYEAYDINITENIEVTIGIVIPGYGQIVQTIPNSKSANVKVYNECYAYSISKEASSNNYYNHDREYYLHDGDEARAILFEQSLSIVDGNYVVNTTETSITEEKPLALTVANTSQMIFAMTEDDLIFYDVYILYPNSTLAFSKNEPYSFNLENMFEEDSTFQEDMKSTKFLNLLGNEWAIDPNINSGYPHQTEIYW